MIRITYFTEVISSWCLWAEPAWAELQSRYAGQAAFGWKIALCDEGGLPASEAQEEWFYRRSGVLTRAPSMLKTGWMEKGAREYLVPNLLAVAAKDFGATGDAVRLALMKAAMHEGRPVNRWEESLPIAAAAAGIGPDELLARARHPGIEQRLRASTAEFHAMQATQRPAFLLQSDIGDRAMFSGIWTARPIAAAIDAMLEDEASYAAWAAHFGAPPAR